jgi:hypothetical protein
MREWQGGSRGSTVYTPGFAQATLRQPSDPLGRANIVLYVLHNYCNSLSAFAEQFDNINLASTVAC